MATGNTPRSQVQIKTMTLQNSPTAQAAQIVGWSSNSPDMEKSSMDISMSRPLSFPSLKRIPTQPCLLFQQERQKKLSFVPLMEGGQRARLSDTCLEYLVQTLQLKKEVTLSSGPFTETLNSESFERHYDALLREPSRIKPQNLIHFELF